MDVIDIVKRETQAGVGRVRRSIVRAAAFVGLVLAATGVEAQPNAPATSTGSYTVSYQGCSGCYMHWLEEKVGDAGTWKWAGQGSVSYTAKPEGRYYYRVAYLYLEPLTYSSWTTYGAQAVVTVAGNVPAVDPLERQLTYRYEVRRGEINGDGRVDLFVNRTSGGTAGNGALEAVVLTQQAGGRFASLVPSAAQVNLARTWPAASAQLLLRDVNADGFADVVLRNVAAAVGSSAAMNQIVYAPGQVLVKAPLGVRSLDGTLRKFAADIYDYLADPNYFAATAPLVTQTATIWEVWCTYSYDIDYTALFPECYYWPAQITVVVPDYSVFSPSAVSIWTNESSIYTSAQTRTKGLDSIESTVEQVLAVPVGGWDLRGKSDEAGSLDEPDYRRGFELFVALFGIGTAEAQEAPRRSDTIYVTGRRVLGWLPFLHTALEYNRATISAFDSDRRTLGNGTLVSQQNWGSDLPHLMMTLGTATRASTAAGVYWATLVGADARYDDNLPYHPAPRAGEGRFNSNGYVHGLVRATGGTTSVDMNRFPGGQAPVPAWVFN